MRFLLFIIVFAFFTYSALAGEGDPVKCSLKNDLFCGKWHDQDDFVVVVTGDRLIYNETSIPCTVMKEGRLEDGRPLSLIKCIKTPDLNYPHVDDSPYPVGYLFVLRPHQSWDRSNDYNVRMYADYGPDLTDPCFSDDAAKKQSCDLQTFDKRSDGWDSLYRPK